MKTISWLPLLLMTFSIAAQKNQVAESVKKHFAEIPMGMLYDDFSKIKPNLEFSDEADFRATYIEKNPTKDIKEITYYFHNGEETIALYEAIIEFNDLKTRESVAATLLGKNNHPTKEDYWIMYKGEKDYDMVAWTFNEKIVFVGKIPDCEWADDAMFQFPQNQEPIDLRFNKKNTSVPKPKPATCKDYAKSIASIFESGFRFNMTADSLEMLFYNIEKQKPYVGFKDEYVLPFNKKGLKTVTFVTDNDDNKPVYEAIFEFDNADSLLLLTRMMFGNPNHPTLENHWSSAGDVAGYISMMWVSENKLVVAVNLPKTEFENDKNFVLPNAGMDEKCTSDPDEIEENPPVFQSYFFKNIKAELVTIYQTGDFSFVFDFTEAEDKQLNTVFTEEEYTYIKKMTDSKNYPAALQSMEALLENLDEFKKAKAYKLAEFKYSDEQVVLLRFPVAENAYLKEKGLIEDRDLIWVCQKKDIEKAK